MQRTTPMKLAQLPGSFSRRLLRLQTRQSPPSHPLSYISISHRKLSSSPKHLNMEPKLSPGSDEQLITSTLKNQLLPPHSHWKLIPSGEGLQRTFKFKTFKAAWAFMDRVAGECKTARHHPEWANVYNTVFVRWTTHAPKGLSEKDVRMAMFCDEIAGELGVLEESGEGGDAGEGVEGVLGGLGENPGECCVPKKKKTTTTTTT